MSRFPVSILLCQLYGSTVDRRAEDVAWQLNSFMCLLRTDLLGDGLTMCYPRPHKDSSDSNYLVEAATGGRVQVRHAVGIP